MAKRRTTFTGFEFREARGSHRVHVFDVIGYNRSKKPICGKELGAMTFPLTPEEVGPLDIEGRVCKACLNRTTRGTA
jgi:hypothetical protein